MQACYAAVKDDKPKVAEDWKKTKMQKKSCVGNVL